MMGSHPDRLATHWLTQNCRSVLRPLAGSRIGVRGLLTRGLRGFAPRPPGYERGTPIGVLTTQFFRPNLRKLYLL